MCAPYILYIISFCVVFTLKEINNKEKFSFVIKSLKASVWCLFSFVLKFSLSFFEIMQILLKFFPNFVVFYVVKLPFYFT